MIRRRQAALRSHNPIRGRRQPFKRSLKHRRLQFARRKSLMDADCASCRKLRKRGRFTKCTHNFLTSDNDAPEAKLEQLDSSTIFKAARAGDMEALKSHIFNGEDIHADNHEQRNALHIAAAFGHLKLVEFLLTIGMEDFSAKDRWGLTALDLAVHGGHLDIAEYLSRHGAVQQITVQSDLQSQWARRLCKLAAEGEVEELRKMMQGGIDLGIADSDNRTALHLAASERQLDCVKMLIEDAHVDINPLDKWGTTPLTAAIEKQNQYVIDYLRSKNAKESDSHVSNHRLLHLQLCEAAFTGNLEETLALLDVVDINAVGYDGRTVLMEAARGGNKEIVSALLEQGADLTALSDWGLDAYEYAMHAGNTDVADLLDSEGVFSFAKQSVLDVVDEIEEEKEDTIKCCKRYGPNREVFHTGLLYALKDIVSRYEFDLCQIWTIDPQTMMMRCCSEACLYQNESFMQFQLACESLPIECMLFFGGKVMRIQQQQTVLYSDLRSISQKIFPLAPAAQLVGLNSCISLPITATGSAEESADEILGAIVLYKSTTVEQCENSEAIKSTVSFVANLVTKHVLLLKEKNSMREFVEWIVSIIDDSNEKTDNSIPTKTDDTIKQVEVLCETGALGNALRCGLSMNSEDHKAVLPLLKSLGTICSCMHVNLWKSLVNLDFVRILIFLSEISPQGWNSSVGPVAQKILENLRSLDLVQVQPPYYGLGKPASPVIDNMLEFYDEMESVWDKFAQKDQLLDCCRIAPPDQLEFSVMSAFETMGQRNNNLKSEEPQHVADFTQSLLRQCHESPLITVENIKEMHRMLDLDKGIDSGTYRDVKVIGSFRRYQIYRVFLPHEEISATMDAFEYEFNNPSGRFAGWHGVMKAYLIFAVLIMFIHPFEDGNGRVGRIFTNAMLLASGYARALNFDNKVLTFRNFLKRVLKKSRRH